MELNPCVFCSWSWRKHPRTISTWLSNAFPQTLTVLTLYFPIKECFVWADASSDSPLTPSLEKIFVNFFISAYVTLSAACRHCLYQRLCEMRCLSWLVKHSNSNYSPSYAFGSTPHTPVYITTCVCVCVSYSSYSSFYMYSLQHVPEAANTWIFNFPNGMSCWKEVCSYFKWSDAPFWPAGP